MEFSNPRQEEIPASGFSFAQKRVLCDLHKNGFLFLYRTHEKLKIKLIKDADCKTQAVCGASALKCQCCGASISLMDGKTCKQCGRNLDLKSYDWVIDQYDIV